MAQFHKIAAGSICAGCPDAACEIDSEVFEPELCQSVFILAFIIKIDYTNFIFSLKD